MTVPKVFGVLPYYAHMAFHIDAVPTELFLPVGTMTPLLSMSDADAADLAIVPVPGWCLSQLRQSLSLSLQAAQLESKALASPLQLATA